MGTRPEAIKMAPLINALKAEAWIELKVVATAQHRDLMDKVLRVFDISPDIDFDIMRPNQSLTTLTANLLLKFDEMLIAERPSAVIAQGDTTTVMTIAMACFYHKIPFGHVEAGLRTWDCQNPFPEEMNRVFAGKMATWHFAPTESARFNLLREGVQDSSITVTGNTVIDALLSVASQISDKDNIVRMNKRLILVTTHRRENFGQPMRSICSAIIKLLEKNSDLEVLFPVHPNPNVKEIVGEMLDGHPQITLCDPLDYLPFVAAMKSAYLIISDSGGVQEEAPALGKPVLVLRNETERPEAIEKGVVKLVGTNCENIIFEAQNLLDNKAAYKLMSRGVSPYGDGHASERIVSILRTHFNS